MKTVIVTGGLGFIGSNLIKILNKKKYFVINIDKVTYAANFKNIPINIKNYKFYKQDINNKNFLTKNKLRLLDFHISLILPIEILSFKEILNILITKYNFFKKSKIIIKGYEIDSNQRLIMKNGTKVKLTEKELELILALNKKNGLDKSFLLKNIWNYNSNLETHAFETHLHRLRKKINSNFKDNKFIIEKNSKYYLF